jgi:hypothetical protein
MMKAHEEWLKAHQLKMKKAGEEFELAYQGVRRALDKNDRYIEKLKRFTKIGTPVVFDMWAT